MASREQSEGRIDGGRTWGGTLARFVLRHRAWLGAVWLATTLLFAHAALTKLSVRAEIEHMIADGSAQRSAAEDPLRGPNEIAVLVRGAVFSDAFLGRLARLERELGTLPRLQVGTTARAVDEPQPPMFQRAYSLLSVPRLELVSDELRRSTLAERLGEGGARIGELARADPAIARRFFDQRAELALILLQSEPLADEQGVAAQHALLEVIARHDRPDFRISVAGLPVLKAMVATILYHDIALLFALAVGVSLLVLSFTFRSAVAVLGPGLVIAATSAWTFGAMAWFGAPLTIVGLYLPAFLTVVAIGDAIHLQGIYRSLRLAGRENHEAIVEACALSAAPVLYTTVTTCVGLLGLRVASIEAIEQLGTFGAFGLATAWLHTVIVIPIALSLTRSARPGVAAAASNDWLARALIRIARLSHPDHGGTGRWVVLALALALISGLGMSKLRVRHEMIEWLPTGNALAPAVELLDRRLVGSATMSVMLELGQDGALSRPDTLARLARAEQRVLAYEDPELGERPIKDANSALDVVRSVWRAVSGSTDPRALPPDADATGGVFQLLDVVGTREMGVFASSDGRRTRVDLRLIWTDARGYARVLEHVRAAFARELGSKVKIAIAGPVADMNRAVNSLLGDLLASFAASCAGIVLTIFLFLRDLRLTALAMLPNLLPIAIVLGAMGFLGYPVDVHTLLLSSVLEGVIVDDTIHFLHHFRDRFRESGDVEGSIAYTFEQAGDSLVITSLTLALGFLTCLAASMHHMQRMALLLSLTIAVALAVELVLTPALIRRYGPRLLRARA